MTSKSRGVYMYFPILLVPQKTQYKYFFVLKVDEAEAKAKQEGKISKKPLLVTSSKFVLIPG